MLAPQTWHHRPRAYGWAGLIALAGMLAACAGGPDADTATGAAERDPLAPRSAPAATAGADVDPFTKAASDLEQFYRDRNAPKPVTTGPVAAAGPKASPRAPLPTRRPPTDERPAMAERSGGATTAAEPDGPSPNSAPATTTATDPAAVGPPAVGPVVVARAAPPTAPKPPESPEAKRSRLINELAATLQQQAGASGAPMREALALTLLSGLDPAVTPGEAQRRLTPEQAEVLDSMRALVAQLIGPEGTPAADPVKLASALADAAAATAPRRMLNVPIALLAWRVEAFGRYTPLASTSFVAGRPVTAVLYTEVENFAARRGVAAADPTDPLPAVDTSEADSPWTVWLTQSVDLFASDGTKAWARPEQSVRDQSRTRRKDFFLTQRLELPANLSIGTYTLRVTVRDKLNAARAEAVIPITIVADPQMTVLKQDWERRSATK